MRIVTEIEFCQGSVSESRAEFLGVSPLFSVELRKRNGK